MQHSPDDADFLTRGDADYPMPQPELERIAQRKWILRHARKGGIGAEIGVFRGHFSEAICDLLAPRKLYLVDPWTKVGATFGWGKAYTAHGKLPTALARDEARARVRGYTDGEIVLIEDYFPACRAALIEPLDFVYLDAMHGYEETLDQLRALGGLIAPGGRILGDDWAPDPRHRNHGVFRAVQDFTRALPWQIVAAGPGGQWALARR